MATYLMELWLWKPRSPFTNPSCRQMHNRIEWHITRLFIYLDGGPPPRKFGEWGVPPPLLVGNGYYYCHCHFAGRNLVRKFESLQKLDFFLTKMQKRNLPMFDTFFTGVVVYKLWLNLPTESHGFRSENCWQTGP